MLASYRIGNFPVSTMLIYSSRAFIPKIGHRDLRIKLGPHLNVNFLAVDRYVKSKAEVELAFLDFTAKVQANFIGGREPWSSGYGRRLMFQRLWVQIPALYTGWTFFTFICCKNFNVYLKRRK